MSTLTKLDHSSTLPITTRFINSTTNNLFNAVCKTLPTAILGSSLGYCQNKTLTLALCSTLQSLFWNYFHPYTFQALFMNQHSNLSSKAVGLVLSYAANLTASYYLTKQIASRLPRLQQENVEPLTKKQVVYASFVPATLDLVRHFKRLELDVMNPVVLLFLLATSPMLVAAGGSPR